MNVLEHLLGDIQMVFSFLLSTAFDATVFTVKYAYSWGRYFVYGHEETSEEKLDKILKEYGEIKHELELVREELKTSHLAQIHTIPDGERKCKDVCQPTGSVEASQGEGCHSNGNCGNESNLSHG